MKRPTMSRREVLAAGGATIAAAAFLSNRWVSAAPLKQGEEVLPWIDRPEDNRWAAIVGNQLEWEKVDTWITPPDQFFNVSRYGNPEIEMDDWRLEITGLVENPMTLSMADIQSWPRQELDYTLECSGNHGFDWIWGLIGNARWVGVALAPLLQEAGVKDDAVEVAFYGADSGEVTVREQTFSQRFARSMSIEDAISPYNILCYEMNDKPLSTRHGFPLRLIAPGWYGVANVKWLERIEVRDRRMMNQFMARDYVTLRQEEIDGQEVWSESSVGRGLLKSAPARVVRSGDTYRIEGAAWGQPIKEVQVRIDDGPWQTAALDTENVRYFSWRFWSLDWPNPEAGEHAITARAIDAGGNVQPAADDPLIAGKITFWESNGQITRRVEIPT